MDENIKERIQKVLASVFVSHNGFFPDEWGPADVEGWDSLRHLDLVMALSEEFEVDLEFEEVLAIEKIGDIYMVLERKGIA